MRKGAKIHFPAIDAEVAVFTRGQAVSTGVKVEGPLKGWHYSYCMTRAETHSQYIYWVPGDTGPGPRRKRFVP